MSGAVSYEGNAFIDGGKIQNLIITNTSISNSVITTSSLDMNLANITSVKDPINLQDAATKKYVDDLYIVYVDVTLSGTSPTIISSNLKGTYRINVTNSIINGPSAAFDVTKNEASNNAHIIRTVACPGISSYTTVNVLWPPNTGIQLYKTGNDYDGNYLVKLM
jgi:hypothetical protein